MTIEQAVCLVGGRGTRLGALTDQAPKPLLEVGGRPFLEYLIDEARRFGLQRLVLLTGYRARDFIARYDGRQFGSIRVEVVVESEPAGTAGALANAAGRLDEVFFLLNGDSFFDCNWLKLVAGSEREDWTVRAALATGIAGSRYGRVDLSGERVTGFRAEGTSSQPINAGIYLVRRSVLADIGSLPCSLEREILPLLAGRGQLIGEVSRGSFIDIGIPEDFTRAQHLMPAFMRRPAAFLDRDGVLNHDHGYVHRRDHFDWVDGAIDAVRWLNDQGFYVFVITNQAGVARGYYGEDAVNDLHAWMQAELQKHGAHIDAFEHCPFHPEGSVERYRLHSDLRKPQPGMILKLQREWTTDPTRSFLVGDRDTDLQAAHAAGLPGFKFVGGNLLAFVRRQARPSRKSGAAG